MKLQTEIAQTISIGSTVHIRDLELSKREIYTLARPSEADIGLNRISTLSPIGRAIYGRRPGEIVEVDAPGGLFYVEIEAIEQLPDLQHARAG